MEVDVRPFDGEPRAFYEAGELAFGERVRDEDFARWTRLFEQDRAIAAFDGDRVVGTAGIFSFELTVPGGVLPAAGVTIVGVHPTHRRQGILRRMMRLQLDAIHDRGEPLAILWASEGSIYQRFGYALATLRAGINLDRDRSSFRLPHRASGTIRFVDADEGARLFPPVYEAERAVRAEPRVPHRPRDRRRGGRLCPLPDPRRVGQRRIEVIAQRRRAHGVEPVGAHRPVAVPVRRRPHG